MVATGVELIPSFHGGILSFETKTLPIYTISLESWQMPPNSQTWAVAQFNGGSSFKWIYPENAMMTTTPYTTTEECQHAVETDVRGVLPTVSQIPPLQAIGKHKVEVTVELTTSGYISTAYLPPDKEIKLTYAN